MKFEYKCDICNRCFKSKSYLTIHKKYCGKYEWVCKFCNSIFNTKKELYIHLHEMHNDKVEMRVKHQYVCEFCEEVFSDKLKLQSHRRRLHLGPVKHTEETRRLLSLKQSEYLKNNPEKHPWKINRFKSKPCEIFKEFLRKNNIEFIEEFTDPIWNHNYSADVAILNKKIIVEINGNQHYNSNGTLKEYYQIRHNIIENSGWIVFEVHYSECYINECLEKILNNIQNNKTYNSIIEIKDKEKKKKYNELIREKRFKLLQESNIDFTKFGWVKQVSKLFNIAENHAGSYIKRNFPDFYKRCYRRKTDDI